MRKVLEALRLLFDHDRRQREIATILGLSQSTLHTCIRRFQHEMIGDATFGDAILDRLVHHAQRLTLTGGSLRRLAPTTKSPAPRAD